MNTLYEDRVVKAELAITQLQKDLDARFLQLYRDELWEAGLIGPHSSAKYKSLKSYCLQSLQDLDESIESQQKVNIDKFAY